MRELTIRNQYKPPYANAEALNRLRVNLELCGTRFKTVMITSSIPSEGKSYVSTNLWRLLGEGGKRTLLVDADMRRSYIRSDLGLSVADGGQPLGLVDFLAGIAELKDCIYSTDYANTAIMPVFRTTNNPTLLLQNGLLPELLEALKERFDYILVDTPPLESVADGLQIAPYCDGTLLVARGGHTPRRLIGNSIRQLEGAECELMGVVLNRVESNQSPYYYKYSKYGYYYKSNP